VSAITSVEIWPPQWGRGSGRGRGWSWQCRRAGATQFNRARKRCWGWHLMLQGARCRGDEGSGSLRKMKTSPHEHPSCCCCRAASIPAGTQIRIGKRLRCRTGHSEARVGQFTGSRHAQHGTKSSRRWRRSQWGEKNARRRQHSGHRCAGPTSIYWGWCISNLLEQLSQ
jgi:hypothetical protein